MLRKTVSGIILAIMLIGMPMLEPNLQGVRASETIYIKADGSVDPPATPIHRVGDAYTFTDNIYDEIVVQKSNIVIEGNRHTLQGSGGGYGFNLNTVNNVTIQNTNIQGFTEGIWLYSSNHNSIRGNNLTVNALDGMYLSRSSNNSINENHISNGHCGIQLSSSSNNSISGNNMSGTNFASILIDGSSNHNSIAGNKLTDGGLFVSFSYGNVMEGNVVNGKPLVFLEDVSDYTVSDAGQVILVNCTNILVENLDLSGTVAGLELWETDNSKITGNNVSNSYYGIWLCSSSNNTVVENNIAYNNRGIELWWASNNRFYHNNFVDNSYQVFDLGWDDPEFPRSTNFWDSGYFCEGNYWSDYAGADSDNDGLGNTFHIIDGDDQDNYPLMGMFASFNTSLGKHVNVVSNSTIEDFEYFESNSTIKMYVSGEEGNGFCRVSIPHVLMNASNILVVIDDEMTPVLYNYTLYDNGTHRWIYFAYEHSTHKVDIIPEFPSFLLLPLFIATLLVVTVYKRKHNVTKEGNLISIYLQRISR